MGYSTDFDGYFIIDPPLTTEQTEYLIAFNETRRMRRDAWKAAKLEDKPRHAVPELRNNVGPDGAYFTGGGGFLGQTRDNSIIDGNKPPEGQPGLWCQWRPYEDGTVLQWDGGEKFYNYTEWLAYLVEHFFTRWGRTLNGKVNFSGEDYEDFGTIFVKDNEIRCVRGERVMPDSPFI